MDDAAVHSILMRFRTFSFAMHDRVRHETPDGLGMQHVMVMKALAEHGAMPQGDLVDLLEITKGAVSQTVSQLEKKRFVERRKDPNDGRVQWVHPTNKSTRLKEELEHTMTGLFRDVFRNWTDDDAKRVAQLLDDLIERAKPAN